MMHWTSLYRANHQPLASVIWWQSLMTCSNLFTCKIPPLVLTPGDMATEACTVGKLAARILLECYLVCQNFQKKPHEIKRLRFGHKGDRGCAMIGFVCHLSQLDPSQMGTLADASHLFVKTFHNQENKTNEIKHHLSLCPFRINTSLPIAAIRLHT